MAQELSEMLSDLSAEAKNVEDGFAAIAQETDAAAAERRERARAAATAAVDTIQQSASATTAVSVEHWRALRQSIDSGIKDLQAGIAQREHERDVKRAEEHAAAARQRAEEAVQVARTAIHAANVAVLDAAVARRQADAVANQ